MLNTLTRIAEPMKEHAEHSFSPLPANLVDEFTPLYIRVYDVLKDIDDIISSGNYDAADEVSERAKKLKRELVLLRKEHTRRLHESSGSLRIEFVYLNLIQETHELISEVRNLLRGSKKYFA